MKNIKWTGQSFGLQKEDFASFKTKKLLETSTIKIVLQTCYFFSLNFPIVFCALPI